MKFRKLVAIVAILLLGATNGYAQLNQSGGSGGGSGGAVNITQIAGVAVSVAAAGILKVGLTDGSGNAITSTGGNLNVQCANCSGSGVSTVDAAAFVASTSLFAGTGGFFQTTATNNALTNLQQGMFQVTANRALFSNLRNASGTEVGTSSTPLQVSLANTAANATAVKVDGSAVTQPVSGTITANIGTSGSLALEAGNLATIKTNTDVPTAILNGQTNVTTAGTRVTLAGSTTSKGVTVCAKLANTGVIFIGNSTVSSANGRVLRAGDCQSMAITNLQTVNLDSSVSGEGVNYFGVN